jgi:hypothetical protein
MFMSDPRRGIIGGGSYGRSRLLSVHGRHVVGGTFRQDRPQQDSGKTRRSLSLGSKSELTPPALCNRSLVVFPSGFWVFDRFLQVWLDTITQLLK